MLSHINAVSSPDVRASLLNSLRLVQDKSKLQLLLPAIQNLLQEAPAASDDLSAALLASFNASTAKDLNDTTKPFWKVFVDLLKQYLPKGTADVAGSVLVDGLRQGLLEKLDQNRKLELCDALLDVCSDHVESVSSFVRLYESLE